MINCDCGTIITGELVDVYYEEDDKGRDLILYQYTNGIVLWSEEGTVVSCLSHMTVLMKQTLIKIAYDNSEQSLADKGWKPNVPLRPRAGAGFRDPAVGHSQEEHWIG